MNSTRSSFPVAAGLLCLALLAPSAPAASQTSDLQGTWEFNAIASGPGAPWWERGHGAIDSLGNYAGSSVDLNGGTSNNAGHLDLSSAGIVTLTGSNNFRGALNTGKTLLAATDTWSTGGAGTTELRVGVKLAPSYALPDLAGNWELNIIASGPGAPWWQRGRINVAPDGNFTGSFTDHAGQSDAVASSFTISPAGIVGVAVSSLARGALDASKSAFVMTNTWTGFAAGTAELSVGVKMAASYTLADLVGVWESFSLATGPGAPRWMRSHMTVAADGGFVSSTSENNGATYTTTGTFTISSAGVMARSGSGSARGVLNAGKNVMVWTSVWTTGSPGTTQIDVATKTSNVTTDVPRAVASTLALGAICPNPFRGGALTVRFALPSGAPACVELLDVSGRRLVSREAGSLGAGEHSLDLSAARPLAPGLYLVRLRQGASTRVGRVVVVE